MASSSPKCCKDTIARSSDSFDFVYFRSIVNVMSNSDEKYDDDTDGRMLFDAIRKGKQHLVRFILEAAPGNIVNARDFNGKTALIVVSSIKEEFRRSSLARLLLFHEAEVNLPDDHGRTPLSYACETRCNDLVDIFVKQRYIDPDMSDDKGNSPLLYCTIVGNDIGTNILVRHFRRLGLKVDQMNKEGYTPLLMAAKNGYISCARILFQQGQASLVARDPIGNLSVEELLEKNGYTLEDLLPLAKQLEAKRRFLKIINFARFAKAGFSPIRHERGKLCERSGLHVHRSPVSASKDIFEKELFPNINKPHLRSACSLPHVRPPACYKSNHTKCRKPAMGNGSVPKHNGIAILPAIGDHRHGKEECHNAGIQGSDCLDGRFSPESDKSTETAFEAMSEEEEVEEGDDLQSIVTDQDRF